MKTVELSAALGQAQVVENLKNFVGVDAQGAAALMTPERLAAVAGGLLKSVNQVGLKPIVIRGTFSHNNSPIELDLCTGILIIFQEGAERMNIYLVDYWSSVIEEKFKNGSSITSVVKSETSGKVTITAASGNFTYLFIGYNYRI